MGAMFDADDLEGEGRKHDVSFLILNIPTQPVPYGSLCGGSLPRGVRSNGMPRRGPRPAGFAA
jgi:hypothetical protein